MNQRYRQWLITAGILIVLALLAIGTKQVSNQINPPNPLSTTSSTTAQSFSYEGQDGKTVLELLKQGHKVNTIDQGSSGVYVESIDGVSQTKNSFWLYYIDGQIGDVSVDKAVTHNGQKVEWRYESF